MGRAVIGLDEDYRRPADLFVRLVALVYAVAFVSLGVQVRGLVGEEGILPAADYLSRLTEMFGTRAFFDAPSIFWVASGDGWLEAACWSGACFSLLAAGGVAQGPLLLLNWALYLSLVSVGQVFLRYQWDVLLLETGFLTLWIAAWKPWTSWRRPPQPPLILVWLVWWLLFRLMFSSGWVKIRTDEVWRNLSALDFHYWTQPLPTWTAWWMHHGPEITRQAGVALTLIAELGLPWLIFLGRPGRKVACVTLGAFQVSLMLTGNFGFFNLLALALCVPLWSRPVDAQANTAPEESTDEGRGSEVGFGRFLSPGRLRRYAAVPLAALILVLSIASLARTEKRDLVLPYPVDALERNLAPFFMVNRYGLFADMTEERPELIVEVTQDGETWEPVRFRWKPGALDERPRFTVFHMPRLDWQMWFEALNYLAQHKHYERRGASPSERTYYPNLWFYRFAARILEGGNPATRLLESVPGEDSPRAVRAVVYRYRFSTPEERRRTGRWWTRQRDGIYLPGMRKRPAPGEPVS